MEECEVVREAMTIPIHSTGTQLGSAAKDISD